MGIGLTSRETSSLVSGAPYQIPLIADFHISYRFNTLLSTPGASTRKSEIELKMKIPRGE